MKIDIEGSDISITINGDPYVRSAIQADASIGDIVFHPRGRGLPGTMTIREFLKEILMRCWDEYDCFYGKRPFGDSGWQWDLYEAIGKAKKVPCAYDDDEFNITFENRKIADNMIRDLIRSL